MTTTTRQAPAPPAMRARDFSGSAVRLVKLLAPQRRTAVAVTVLSVAGTAIGVVVPRILGHATDLLFNGVIGRRLPAGITKDQAVVAARRSLAGSASRRTSERMRLTLSDPLPAPATAGTIRHG